MNVRRLCSDMPVKTADESPLRRRCVLFTYDLANIGRLTAGDDLAAKTAWDTPFVGEHHKHIYQILGNLLVGLRVD